MDETARAIARDLEESRSAKEPEADQPASTKSKLGGSPMAKVTARLKSTGPASSPQTRRTKMGGGG